MYKYKYKYKYMYKYIYKYFSDIHICICLDNIFSFLCFVFSVILTKSRKF